MTKRDELVKRLGALLSIKREPHYTGVNLPFEFADALFAALTAQTAATVQVPVAVAQLIRKVYLPMNPNKLRTAHPDVKKAVNKFIELLTEANKESSHE